MKTCYSDTVPRRASMASSALLACLLGFNLPPALAGPGAWTRKADVPTTTVGASASCAINGILYVAGGALNPSAQEVRTLLAYSPRTDSWTQKKDMPTARAHAAGAAADGIFYVIGGYNAAGVQVATVECYDPKSDQWTTLRNLPEAAPAPVAVAVNGTIYVFGQKSTFAYNAQAIVGPAGPRSQPRASTA